MVVAVLASESPRFAAVRGSSVGEPVDGLTVFCERPLNDFRRQVRPWGRLVPPTDRHEFLEVLAQKLLVETLLRPARLVACNRPEPRAIRGQRFIDKDNLVGSGKDAKLELGIGNDDPTSRGILRRLSIDLK